MSVWSVSAGGALHSTVWSKVKTHFPDAALHLDVFGEVYIEHKAATARRFIAFQVKLTSGPNVNKGHDLYREPSVLLHCFGDNKDKAMCFKIKRIKSENTYVHNISHLKDGFFSLDKT